MSNAKDNFKKEVSQKVEKAMSNILKLIANEAQTHFVEENLEKESFQGTKWKEVQRRTEGTNAYKYPKGRNPARRTRGILRGETTKLFRALTRPPQIKGKEIVFKMPPYAKYHNEGEAPQPKRTFIAMDKKLLDKINRLVKAQLDKLKS